MLVVALFLGGYVLFYITSPFLITFHELGHAVAYFIFTKPTYVNIYIGSYGDSNNHVKFKIGKLHFFVKFTFPLLKGGMCQSSHFTENLVSEILILLAGPIFSLIIASVLTYLAFDFDLHGALKLFCFALLLFTLISMFTNLYPKTIVNNLETDGQQILFIIKIRKVYNEYNLAIESYNKKEFELSANHFKKVLSATPDNGKILRLLTNALIQIASWKEVVFYLKILKQTDGFQFKDYLNLASTYSILGENDAAISIYEESLILQPNNQEVLNFIISSLIDLKRYKKAGEYLIKLKKRGKFDIYNYLNLGYIQSIFDESDAAVENYHAALQLEPENLYALNNLAYEYTTKHNFDAARVLLVKGLHIYPDSPSLLNSLGFLEILVGNLQDGKVLVERTLLVEEYNAYAYKHLAIYYIKIGDRNNAIKNLQKAQELDPYIKLDRLFTEANNLPYFENKEP